MVTYLSEKEGGVPSYNDPERRGNQHRGKVKRGIVIGQIIHPRDICKHDPGAKLYYPFCTQLPILRACVRRLPAQQGQQQLQPVGVIRRESRVQDLDGRRSRPQPIYKPGLALRTTELVPISLRKLGAKDALESQMNKNKTPRTC
jgi:hypothetical protein